MNHRYIENSYNETALNTIGIDFKIKFVDILDKKIKVFLFDTAG